MKITKEYLRSLILETLTEEYEEEEEQDDPFQSIHRRLDQGLISNRAELKPELEDIVQNQPEHSEYANELLMLLKQKNGTSKVREKLGQDLGFGHPSDY